MADGEAEARFSHLLQPIRDLARNWDIDIASSLEDYLEELDQLKISLDGGEANLNFAEAALLIQGTACIYSRKVEYLHSLVFQVLDRLAGSQGQQGGGKGRRGAGAGQGDGDGKDDDDDHALLGGAGDPFPLLDSLLEEGRGEIDLKPQLVLESLKAAANPNGGAGKGGSKGPAPHCRPPLLVMEECNASFKVATCSVHKSGALLMEESLRRELEPALAAEKGKRRPSYGMVYDGDRQAVGEEEEDDAMGGADAAWGAGGGGDDYHHDDDDFRMDDDGGGCQEEGGAPMPMEEEGAAVAGTVAVPQGQEEPGQGRELRSRHKQQQQEAEQQEEEDEDDEEFEDPWAALDPHDPGKAPPRPFRKGKTPKAPPMPKAGTPTSTSEPSAASVASAAFLSLTGLTFGEFAPIAKALEAAAKRRTRVRRAQQQPRQPEDDRRASGRRRSMALYAAVTAPAPLAEGRVAEAAALAAGSGSGAAGGAADDLEEDDDDDMIGAADAAWMGGGGGDDFQHGGDDDFRMDDDGHWGGGAGGGMEQEAWHEGEGAAAAALGGAFGEEGGSGGRRRSYAPVSLEDGGLLDDAFAGAAQSYEALCRKHMDAFMRGLEAYAHETQLTRRVADWQDKVEPMLEVQERRTPFDIHDCGDEILTTLAKEELEKEGQENAGGAKGNAAMEEAEAAAAAGKKKGKGAARESVDGGAGANQERSFQEIVSGKEQYEVCRLFLASLQLANNGNVQLVHEAGPQDKDGLSFRLNLLSDQRMHERFTGTELGDIETAH